MEQEIPLEVYQEEGRDPPAAKIDPTTGLPAGFIDVLSLDSKSFSKTWLVEDLIEEGRTIEFFGTWKLGESLTVLDMAAHASLGITWAGQGTIQTLIVWIAREAVEDIERRIRAWRLRHGITGLMPFYIRATPVHINQEAAAKRLREEIELLKARHPGLPTMVVIDTVAMSLSPGTNENSIEGMGALASNLISLVVNPTGAAAICIHHSGHGDSERGRGHSSFPGALDADFKVTKQEQPGGPEIITVEPKFRRSGPRLEAFHFRIEVQELGGTDNFGKPIAEPVLHHLTDYVPARKDPLGKHEIKALVILGDMYERQAENLKDRPGAEARVAESDWRVEFNSSFSKDTKAGTRRIAWMRAKEALTEAGKVRIQEGFAYLAYYSGS